MRKLQLSVAMLGLAMAACTSNEEIAVEEVKGIETISAEIIQPAGMDSRVIVGKPVNGFYPLKWRADDPKTSAVEADVIYVYDSKGNAARFIYSESETDVRGTFTKDPKSTATILDIKNALCVPTAVGRPNDLPKSMDASFNYMSTMMYNRGAENAPMYGEMKDGVLQFKMATGMMELDIPNLKSFRPNEEAMLGLKIQAYDKEGGKKIISGTDAKIDFTNADDPVVVINGGDDFIGLFLQKGVSATGTKLYFPLVTGEYGKIEISIWPNTSFTDIKKRQSEIVTLSPKAGKTSFTIEKKMYSVKKEFVKLADANAGDQGGINTPEVPQGENDFDVK